MFTKEFQIRLHLNSILEYKGVTYILVENHRLGIGYYDVPRKDCPHVERKIFELYQKIFGLIGKHELIHFRLDSSSRWCEFWLDEDSDITWHHLTNYRNSFDPKTGKKVSSKFI